MAAAVITRSPRRYAAWRSAERERSRDEPSRAPPTVFTAQADRAIDTIASTPCTTLNPTDRSPARIVSERPTHTPLVQAARASTAGRSGTHRRRSAVARTASASTVKLKARAVLPTFDAV